METKDNSDDEANVEHAIDLLSMLQIYNTPTKFSDNAPQTPGQRLKLDAALNFTEIENQEIADHSNRSPVHGERRKLHFGVWNINPDNLINANQKRIFIREILGALNCDICALQECVWVPRNFDMQLFNRKRNYAMGTHTNHKNAIIYYDKDTIFKIKTFAFSPAKYYYMNTRCCIGMFRLKQSDESYQLHKAYAQRLIKTPQLSYELFH